MRREKISLVCADSFFKAERTAGCRTARSSRPETTRCMPTLTSGECQAVQLVGHFGKLSDVAGTRTADTVGAGGKITVCVAPVWSGEAPRVTFDVTARFRVYRR